jgi:hypothetical protein
MPEKLLKIATTIPIQEAPRYAGSVKACHTDSYYYSYYYSYNPPSFTPPTASPAIEGVSPPKSYLLFSSYIYK